MTKRIWMSLWVLVVLFGTTAQAADEEYYEQKISQLEAQIGALEEYLQDLAPRLNSFSRDIYKNINERVRQVSDKVIAINPVSRKFNKIETNAGDFLLAVDDMEKINNGYRLTIKIGNPNSAIYEDVHLRIFWGRKWDPENVKPTYEEWRSSLTGAEYKFGGPLESGKWTEVVVDLTPAAATNFEYIECEMDVGTVKLLAR